MYIDFDPNHNEQNFRGIFLQKSEKNRHPSGNSLSTAFNSSYKITFSIFSRIEAIIQGQRNCTQI